MNGFLDRLMLRVMQSKRIDCTTTWGCNRHVQDVVVKSSAPISSIWIDIGEDAVSLRITNGDGWESHQHMPDLVALGYISDRAARRVVERINFWVHIIEYAWEYANTKGAK